MEHVRQTELIQFVAGGLPDARHREVEGHLATCPACRTLFEQQDTVWRALGAWTPAVPSSDLVTEVEKSLAEPSTAPHPLGFDLRRFSRVAAAVLIGVGAGYGAARVRPAGQSGPPLVAPAHVEQAAAEALGIDFFEDASPTGLYAAWLDLSAVSEQEEES